MENFEKVETYKVTYTCDQCGVGTMVPTKSPQIFKNYKALYVHKCSDCKAVQELPKLYPLMEYR